MVYKNLKKNHPKLFEFLEHETKRQQDVINLIPSENYVSEAVLEALGTVFTNKYAEGYAGARYYFGNTHIDEVEEYTKSLVLQVFKVDSGEWSVNVQPYSGSPANLAVYHALLEPGDKVLAMHLSHGGHLTHGHKVSVTGKLWNFQHYTVNRDGWLDYDEIETLAHEHKPKLIVCGASAYARIIDFEKFAQVAKSVGALLMADISHIAGLIVGGMHPSPFPYADVVTTTTHKTLRGPRAALIVSRKSQAPNSKFQIADLIDKAVFPGLQGGPHENTILAVAVALEEALRPEFTEYTRQIVLNANMLAAELVRSGFPVISGGTDNHLMLVDVSKFVSGGQEAGQLLEQANVVVNKNMIPYDTRKPTDPSGIRLGTPAVTTRGMKEKEMQQVAGFIKEVLLEKQPPAEVKKRVLALTIKFPLTR